MTRHPHLPGQPAKRRSRQAIDTGPDAREIWVDLCHRDPREAKRQLWTRRRDFYAAQLAEDRKLIREVEAAAALDPAAAWHLRRLQAALEPTLADVRWCEAQLARLNAPGDPRRGGEGRKPEAKSGRTSRVTSATAYRF